MNPQNAIGELEIRIAGKLIEIVELLFSNYKYEESLSFLDKLINMQPTNAAARATRVYARLQLCDWDGLEEEIACVEELVLTSPQLAPPFSLMTMNIQPHQLLFNAHLFGQYLLQKEDAQPFPQPAPREYEVPLRIGFLSNDFRCHVVGSLIADLVERLDRSRFELIAYSFGPDDKSSLRKRLESGFDRFVDITEMTDEEAADCIRRNGTAILIDLKGYTQGARTAIPAYRPAPVQVRWLGHAGTTGQYHYDYLLVDDFAVPPSQQPFYTEKLAHLPHAYQVCQREVSEATLMRSDVGLPDNSFVFCSFNAPYKITPDLFSCWMEILQAVPDSVLWLIDMRPPATGNLRKTIAEYGLSDRVIFAPFAPRADHLKRYHLADLFLDSYWVSACATCADALWGGCPVLTCVGESYASRAAGSILSAAGLTDMACPSLSSYRERAIALATNRDQLEVICKRLEEAKASAPLFDIDTFCTHYGVALETMWHLFVAGRKPAPFKVFPDASVREYAYQESPIQLES